MAMTYAEFEIYASRLMEISEKLRDGWRELTCSENKTIYLVKTQRAVMICKTYMNHVDQNVRPHVSDSSSFLTSWKLPSQSNVSMRCKPVLTAQRSPCISFNEDRGETTTMETVLESRNQNESGFLKRLKLTKSPSSYVLGRRLTVSNISHVDIEPENSEDSDIQTNCISSSSTSSSKMSQVQNLDHLHTISVLDPIELSSSNNTEDLVCSSLMPEPENFLYNEVEIDVEDDLSTHQVLDNIHNSSFTWEYHIVYSSSYGVPVLYFNVWTTSGAFLKLDQVWNILEFNIEDKWAALTQVEHPYLRKPYFQLHPCRTQHLIETITKIDNSASSHQKGYVNKLVSWLSCIAPYVHLDFSIEYGNSSMTSVGVEGLDQE